MYTYLAGHTLTPLEQPPQQGQHIITLLTSEELAAQPKLSGLESVLHHTPPARDARVCRAEVRRDCLCGTVVTPRSTREGQIIAFGFLLTQDRLVLSDDTGAVHSLVKGLMKEKRWTENSAGRFFYELMELLIAKDLHHLQGLEMQAGQLEDQVLTGNLDDFNGAMTSLRKGCVSWFRYYSQLDDLACELLENENGFLSDNELRLYHMLEKRVNRLLSETQLLREYCMQIRGLFQSEVDIRQNRTMKILTVVTTLFLPLTLVTGWYGMNFANMPELDWEYGYPAVIGVSVLVIIISLWICKKKKFW